MWQKDNLVMGDGGSHQVRDRVLIISAAFLRSIAISMMAVLLGLYLTQLKFDTREIGWVVSAGLAGATVSVVFVTIFSNRCNRRLVLCLMAWLSGLGATLLISSDTVPFLVSASFFGMINGMGRDRGASLVLEQALLPATVSDQQRTVAFAWYNVLQDLGHGIGSLLAATPFLLQRQFSFSVVDSYRLAICAVAGVFAISGTVYLFMSRSAFESVVANPFTAVSAQTRRILVRISTLFALDSFGGGFLTAALISVFFHQRFGTSIEVLALLYFASRICNALSHLGAAWLAKRIGLVNTMVFTHIPSSLLLVTIAIAPNFEVAAVLFLLRESLVEMDVPTRQSYVMAVVAPHERTIASGVTHLVRLAAWATAPMFAGTLMKEVALLTPLLVAAGMKIAYDVILYFAFRGIKPPEEEVATF
ncbi:MAG: MFS transporter [Candidatus Melainabacteria bacterium]|nr:MFS transporter [Candidatus Melainabacteria bacterium]